MSKQRSIVRNSALAILAAGAFSLFGLLMSHAASASDPPPTCTITWTGLTSDNWGTTTNWLPDTGSARVPNGSDFVCMSATATTTSVLINSSTTANAKGISFPSSGLQAPTLTVDGPLNLGSDASTIDNVTVNDSTEDGEITGSVNGVSLTIEGAGVVEDAELSNLAVVVAGTTSVPTNDSLELGSGATLEVVSDGTLAVGNSSQVTNDGSGEKAQINFGGVLKYTGSSSGDFSDIEVPITIDGAVDVSTATLRFDTGGVLGSTASAATTGSGSASIESTFTAGPSGGALSGFTIDDGTLEGVQGAGAFTVPAGQTTTMLDSDVSGATLDNVGTLIIAAGNNDQLQSGSQLDNTGTLEFGVASTLNADSDSNGDLLTNESTGTMEFTGHSSSDMAVIQTPMTDNGTADVTTGSLEYNDNFGTVGPDQNVVSHSGGVFQLDGTLSPTGDTAASTGSVGGILGDDGTLTGPGTLTIPVGQSATWPNIGLSGGAHVMISGSLTVPADDNVGIGGGSTLENAGTLDLVANAEGGASIDDTDEGSGDVVLNDVGGVVEAEAASIGQSAALSVNVTNKGTLLANFGSLELEFTTTVTSTSTATSTNGGSVVVDGFVQPPSAAVSGSIVGLTFANNSSLEGPGTLTLPADDTVTFQGPFLTGAVVLANSGTLLFQNGSDTDIDGASEIENFGTMQMQDSSNIGTEDSTAANQIINETTGTILYRGSNASQTASISVPISNDGLINAMEGTLNVFLRSTSFPQQGATNDGTLTGGNYVVDGTLDIQDTAQISGGTTTTEGSPDLSANAATLIIGTTGMVETSSGDQPNALNELSDNTATGALTTLANLDLAQALTQSGTLTVSNGTFEAPSVTLSGNSTTTVDSAGTLESNVTLAVPASGALPVLTGAGVVDGNISNGGGNAQPPTGAAGTLRNTGNYTETPATGGSPVLTIGIEAAGSTPGTDFGKLAVSGVATLGGKLTIVPAAGYTPTLGDTFTVLTASSLTGIFKTIAGAKIGATGLYFAVSYTAKSVVITVAKPSVTSISPTPLGQGASGVPVTISGLGFASGDTVSSGNTGVTFSHLTIEPSGQAITADASVAATAAVGTTSVIVKPSSGASLSCASCLKIDAKPTITKPSAASPTLIGPGTTAKSVTVTGTGFSSPASHPLTVSFGGVGTKVTAKISGTVTATSFTMLVTVPGSATTGLYNIRVDNGDYGIGGCTACVRVEILPTVTKFTPKSAGQGASGLAVTIIGTHFTASPKITCSASGVTFSSVTEKSSTKITAIMKVSARAHTGKANITVTDKGQGSGTLRKAVKIDPAPDPKSLSPKSLPQKSSNKVVKLSGSDFESGAKVAFSGSGVTDTVTSITSTTIELKVSVSKRADKTFYSVTVTDPDGGTGTCKNCFSVSKAAGPRLPATVAHAQLAHAQVAHARVAHAHQLTVRLARLQAEAAVRPVATRITGAVRVKRM
jgi:hypothetical protein